MSTEEQDPDYSGRHRDPLSARSPWTPLAVGALVTWMVLVGLGAYILVGRVLG